MKSAPPAYPSPTWPAGQEGKPAPPTTNRGVQRTEPPPPVLLDWLAYTAPDGTELADILPDAERLDWTELETGGLGYRRQLAAEGIRVYFDGQPGMGMHVSISGSACRAMEARMTADGYHLAEWPTLLRYLRDSGFKVTRCDVALDDRAGALDMPTIVEAVKARECVTRFKTWRKDEGGRIGKPEQGVTLYLGAPSSETRVRFYDKRAERVQAGDPDPGPWVRVELQLRHETAAAMIERLIDAAGAAEPIAAALRGLIDFRTPSGTDSNRRRWLPAEWWLSWLAGVETAALTLQPAQRTLAKVLRWIEKQVAPSLALLTLNAGGDLAPLAQLAAAGAARLRPRHYALAGLAWEPPPAPALPF